MTTRKSVILRAINASIAAREAPEAMAGRVQDYLELFEDAGGDGARPAAAPAPWVIDQPWAHKPGETLTGTVLPAKLWSVNGEAIHVASDERSCVGLPEDAPPAVVPQPRRISNTMSFAKLRALVETAPKSINVTAGDSAQQFHRAIEPIESMGVIRLSYISLDCPLTSQFVYTVDDAPPVDVAVTQIAESIKGQATSGRVLTAATPKPTWNAGADDFLAGGVGADAGDGPADRALNSIRERRSAEENRELEAAGYLGKG